MSFEYKFTIELDSNRFIEAKAFSLSDYLDIISAKESDTYTDVVVKVIDKCINEDIFSFPKREAEFILLQLWAASVGKINYEAEYTCCGSLFYVPMNMSRVQIDKQRKVKKTFGDFIIQFKEPKLFDDSDYIETFMESIEYIIVGENQFNVDELSEEDYQAFIGTITADDVDESVNEILMPTIRMGIPVKCPICGSYHVEELIGLHDLLGVLQ